MNISIPKYITKDHDLILQYQVNCLDHDIILWYSLDEIYRHFVTDLLDGPLVALLIPAMHSGEDIYLQGKISERLYYNLSQPYQEVLKYLIPSLKSVKIYPEGLQSKAERAKGVATGLSCGVDSFCLLGDHYYSDVPTIMRFRKVVLAISCQVTINFKKICTNCMAAVIEVCIHGEFQPEINAIHTPPGFF